MSTLPKDDGSDSPIEKTHNPTKRSYYYDDAHGYEDFDPEADDNDNDKNDRPEGSDQESAG